VDLHAFSEAMYNKGRPKNGTKPEKKSEYDEYYDEERDYEELSSGKSLEGIIGVER